MWKIVLSYLCLTLCSSDIWGVILDPEGKPLPPVIHIFRTFYPEHIPDRPSLEDLNIIGQERFLRPQGSDRLSAEAFKHYEALCDSLSPDRQEELLNCFTEIGDLDAVTPQHQTPDYILIHGSLISLMRQSLIFLADLVREEKIVLKPHVKIVLITGDRKLFEMETKALCHPAPFKVHDGWTCPDTLPDNELDLGKFVWEQLDLGEALRQQSPLFIGAEKKPGEVRAQTEDGVKTFLENISLPERAQFLVISSNPFVFYQTRVTEGMFKKLGFGNKNFHFEGAGTAAPVEEYVKAYGKSIAIGMLLDNLARTLYVEKQIKG